MPTKIQVKAAVDATCATAKTDIDSILPVGVDIIDGNISFAPTKFIFKMNAGGSQATADTWATTITGNLTAAGRTYFVRRSGRREGDGAKVIVIETTLATYFIVNIT